MSCSPILPNYSMEIGCQGAETLLQLGKTGLQRGKVLRRLLQLGKTGLERGKVRRRLLQLGKTGLERRKSAEEAAPIGQNRTRAWKVRRKLLRWAKLD
ncbi:hypothetical protein [Paenibacillus aestuarii]|uniref:Uncharacterized protein n=1 Tax=Paenibacillus aestuarii TaxID=516965 RepID=A0ABW0K5Q4_9BACL|nr:hypothetical protein [Paenibacillus aestuarii]